MNQRPDTGTRILVATMLLALVVWLITGGHGIWSFAERPLP